MNDKHARLGTSSTNPFIDPEGYHRYVEDREKAFLAALAKQQAK
jgi:hypothetical protein